MIDGSDDQDIALAIARCLHQMPETDLHVLGKKKWTALHVSRLCKSYTLKNTNNDSEWLEAIKETAKKYQVDILFAAMEPGIQFLAAYRSQLQKIATIAPTTDLNTLKQIIDKRLLAEFVVTHNIPAPKTIVYTGNDQFEQQLTKITFPVLFKPNFGGGGWGIVRINSEEELRSYLNDLPDYSNIIDKSYDMRFLIQEYVPGYNMGCSILACNGEILAVTIQQQFLSRPSPYEPAAGVQFLANDDVIALVTQFTEITNFSGVAHLDLRFDERDGSIKLIEVNARYWQSLLGSLKMGINFPQLAIYTSLHIPFAKPVYTHGRFVDIRGLLRDPKKFGTNMKNKLARKTDETTFLLSETDIRFALLDPLPEISRFLTK